jgi:hypothetical protein
MHFRLRCRVDGLRIETDLAALEFVVGTPPVRVQLEPVTAADIDAGATTASYAAVARAERRASDGVRAAFVSLSEGRIPEGSTDLGNSAWGGYLNEDGSLNSGARLPLPTELLPANVQSFVNQIREQLHGAVRQVVDVIRWRGGVPGPPDPITSRWRSAEWSLDGDSWHVLPSSFGFVIRGSQRVWIDADTHEALQSLLRASDSEPTGHVLFREAWELRNKHLRSALLTGVAAMEVGFKDFAADLVPDAEWLLVNVATPPVVRMLREFLPKIRVHARICDKVLPPPKSILDLLERGVGLRNQVAHAGARRPTVETVETVLLAIEDVLWLLDYYRGHEWAWWHMRPETRAGLAPDWNPG